MDSRNIKDSRKILLSVCILAAVFLFSLFLGRYPRPGVMNPSLIFRDPLAHSLVFNLRLPRTLTALLLGMILSSGGMVFQMIFSNPLVEPGFLGVSQGAAFGAAFSIIFLSSSVWVIQGTAAAAAISGLFLSYTIARRIRFGGWVLRLVLSGIAVSALFSAGVGILKYTADPMNELPEITFWMLGGLWNITWRELLTIFPVSVVSLFILFFMRWRLNVLSLDDETAFSLGLAPGRERIIFLVTATAATAAIVSVSGIVSWVGLIIPHIARRIFKTDTRFSLPGSMVLGGIFGLICDMASRTLLAGEIPLGIFTSFLGAGIFILLLMSRNIKVEK